MAKSNTINIAIEVDDKGSVKLRKIGDEAKKTGDKGAKSMGRFRKGIANLDDSMKLTLPTITQMATGAAALATATVAGAVAMINSAASQAKEIEKLSRLANMGSVDFQNYAYATESVGVSAEKLADISKDVQERLGDFIATGGGEFADFFENIAPKIGLTAQELQGLSGPDILFAVKDGMDAVNLSAEEQIFYLESLASDASLLTPLLKDNGAALKEQAAEAHALGIAISEIESQNLLEAGKATKQLTGLFGGLKNKLAAELAPVLTDVVGKIVDGMTNSAGGIDTLSTKISTGLLQALKYVLKGVEFFHTGWLKLQTAIPVIVDAFQGGIELIYNMLHKMLTPLDLIFDGIAKTADFLGQEFTNPLDLIGAKIEDFGKITQGVMEENFQAIIDNQEVYDGLYQKIDEYSASVKAAAEEEKAAAAVATEAAALKIEANVAIVKAHIATGATILKADQERIDAQVKLEESLADKVNQLSLSKYHYAVQKLDDEVAKMQEVAGTNKTIQDQITSYHKLKLDEINVDFHLSKDEITDGYLALKEAVSGTSGHMTLNFGAIKTGFEGQTTDSKGSSDLIKGHYVTLNDVVAGDAGIATAMFTALKKGFGATREKASLSLLTDGDSIKESYIKLHTDVSGEVGSMTVLGTDIGGILGGMKDKAGESLLTDSDSIKSSYTGLRTDVGGEGGIFPGLGVDIDGIFDGMQDKADEIINTNPASMTKKFSGFSTDVQLEIKTGLSKTLITEFGGLETAWGGVWDNMLTKMAGVLVEMATSWTVSAVGSMFEGWDIFHAGIWNLQDDEVPSILQQGEMVIPKEHADNIRKNVGNGFDGDFGSLVDSMGVGDPGKWGENPADKAFSKGLWGGVEARTIKEAVGLFTGRDFNLARIADPMAMGFDVAKAMLGAGLDASMPSGSMIGGKEMYGTAGGFLGYGGTMVGLSGLGAVAKLGAPIGQRIGEYLGDKFGDLVGDRSFEDVRDSVEAGTMTPSEARGRISTRTSIGGQNHYGGSNFGGLVGAMKDAIEGVKDHVRDIVADAISAMSDHSTGGNDGGGPVGDQSSSGDATGPGHGGTPEIGGYALGGGINQIWLPPPPTGDDGWIGAKIGEGMVNEDGMEFLGKINRQDNDSFFRSDSPVVSELRKLRAEVRSLTIAIAEPIQRSSRIHRRWFKLGIKIAEATA